MKQLSKLVHRPDLKMALNINTGVEHQLDEMGDFILDQLKQGKSIETLAQEIAKEYEASPEMVISDIQDLISTLMKDLPNQINQDTTELYKDPNIQDEKVIFPVNLELELTRICNWSCQFCYNTWKTQKKEMKGNPHLPLEQIVALQKECSDNGLFRIRYSGGEPSLHPDFDQIIQSGAKHNLYQVVFTNGTTLTTEKSKYLSENNVKEILISMHGSPSSHNNLVGDKNGFKKTIKAIEEALKQGINVIVEMTLVNQNIKDIAFVIKTIKELGVHEFRLMRYVSTSRNDQLFGVYYPQFRDALDQIDPEGINITAPCSQRHCLSETKTPIINETDMPTGQKFLNQHCNAGVRWMAVNNKGEAKVCPHDTRTFGDISEGVKNIWQQKIQPFAISNIQKNITKACQDCILQDICKGGCHLSFLN